MPINLQGSGNIAEGWGPPPQLHAPEIGSLVGAILRNRLGQQELTQKSVADAIKEVQQQRESAAYTDALQKAGLLPEGDYGGLGIKGGASLAGIIQRQQALEAMETHRRAMEARIGGRGRGGGSGGGSEDTQVEAPEDYYGLHNAPGIPTTKTINGIVHVRTPKGVWKPGPKWMQDGTTGQTPKLSPTEKGWAAPEIPGLSVNINAPDDTIPLAPDIPPMPEPQGTPQSAPADKNLAQGYGTDATSMSSDDVRAAYRAGKMTREEAQARLKAMGFSD